MRGRLQAGDLAVVTGSFDGILTGDLVKDLAAIGIDNANDALPGFTVVRDGDAAIGKR